MSGKALEAARSMGAIIMANRHETETSRRLAKPIVDRLVEERLCRMFLPEEFGGHPATPVEALEVFEALAGFEASVPWIVWNNALVCCFSRFLARDVRVELFSNPDWLVAQSTRPSGTATATDGGFRVSGRWSLVSGCELAEWLLLHCAIDSEQTVFVVVRRNDFSVLDTWHTGGLRGSGSHDVVVDDVFVPGEYALTLSATSPPSNEPIDRLPINVHLVAIFAAQALGIASASVAFIVDTARNSESLQGAPAMRERGDVQLLCPRHATALDAARSHLHACIDQLWTCTLAGDSVGVEPLARAYASAIHANNASREAVDAMYALGGTAALYIDSPLERAHRDLNAMLRHVVAQPAILVDAGRAMLGQDPLNPLYFI